MMLNRQTLKTALSAVLLTSVGLAATAQKQSPVPSKADPFKLDIVAPVMMAGSDDASATFQETVLPSITKFLSAERGEGKPMSDLSGLLDPSKLTLKTAAGVRVYFIGEGASFENSLGFNTLDAFSFDKDSGKNPGNGGNGKSDLPEAIGADGLLIFPNASSPVRRGMCMSNSSPAEEDGMVELLAAGSSPTRATAPPCMEVPLYTAWRRASAARSTPGALPYQIPTMPS